MSCGRRFTLKPWLRNKMHDWFQVFLLTAFAGLAMPFGAVLAGVEHIKYDWLQTEVRHGVLAFGGGALLSAIALVLIPEGVAHLSIAGVVIAFLAGGFTFASLDVYLSGHDSPMSQLVAMLSDFLPEAVALGAAMAMGNDAGILLAMLMALQNVPEGFNAFRELKDSAMVRGRVIVATFIVLAALGPVCGLVGFYWLVDYPTVVAVLMVFAAGGILYIVFGDIAPQAKLEKHWLPPMGAVLGFLLGVVGQMVVG